LELTKTLLNTEMWLSSRQGVGNYFCSGATLRPALNGGPCLLMRVEASLGLQPQH